MRVASWVFVLCTTLGAIGVFLPSVELHVGGRVSKRTELSLYTASTHRELVRRLLAAYHGSTKRRTGAEIIGTVAPRVHGRARAALDDARDAMETLDATTDDDVKTAGIALAGAVWALLGLDAMMLLLVFVPLMRGGHRRGHLIWALAASAIAAALAVALHLVCREVAWQANDEVGRSVVVLASGAYVIPIAAVASLAAAVVLLRQRRSLVTPLTRNRSRDFSQR